jgi:hypothetical protein
VVYESQISCQEHNHGRQQITEELVKLYLHRNNERVRKASILQGKVGRFRGRYWDD